MTWKSQWRIKMTSKDEALKMAIKALETTWAECDYVLLAKVINACKEALQQPAQDFFERGKEIAKWADKQNEQPAQEPVAWMCTDNYDEVVFLSDKTCIECQPLYTHPVPSSKCEECGMKYCECGER
ncbi:hypothetical protein UFOVP17_55 [uncultured Caudovirales phage]|uniref:Uncharacterized protein n=1 Tax=uncultured Caudovirales phage TaxID=2100421 RepID=A0A6J5KLA7_9CAUD|nr:hypothetical protein UFOVP17_55 [uncultured Caudovirales phage]